MIRPAAQSIENIIRGYVQEWNLAGCSHESQVTRAESVRPIRSLRVSLRVVHSIIRGGIEDQVGSICCDHRADRIKVGNIELTSVVSDNLVITKDALNGMTELTARTSEENMHACSL